jgi:hypothetical protein
MSVVLPKDDVLLGVAAQDVPWPQLLSSVRFARYDGRPYRLRRPDSFSLASAFFSCIPALGKRFVGKVVGLSGADEPQPQIPPSMATNRMILVVRQNVPR